MSKTTITHEELVEVKQNEIANIVEKEYTKLSDPNDSPKKSWYEAVKFAEGVNVDFLATTDQAKWKAIKAHFATPTT